MFKLEIIKPNGRQLIIPFSNMFEAVKWQYNMYGDIIAFYDNNTVRPITLFDKYKKHAAHYYYLTQSYNFIRYIPERNEL